MPGSHGVALPRTLWNVSKSLHSMVNSCSLSLGAVRQLFPLLGGGMPGWKSLDVIADADADLITDASDLLSLTRAPTSAPMLNLAAA